MIPQLLATQETNEIMWANVTQCLPGDFQDSSFIDSPDSEVNARNWLKFCHFQSLLDIWNHFNTQIHQWESEGICSQSEKSIQRFRASSRGKLESCHPCREFGGLCHMCFSILQQCSQGFSLPSVLEEGES